MTKKNVRKVAESIMKLKNTSDSLLNRSSEILSAGMRLFHEVQTDPSSINMIKRQAELIHLLERLLKIASSEISQQNSDKTRPLHFNESDQTTEKQLAPGRLPVGDDPSAIAGYLLACWLDELFVVDSPLARQWNENKMEMRIFGTNDRAWRFWDYVNSDAARHHMELQEIALLCVLHGFQGQWADSHAELSLWVEKSRARLLKSTTDSWSPPPTLPIMANSPPLRGQIELDLVVRLAIIAGVLLVPAISFFMVYSIGS